MKVSSIVNVQVEARPMVTSSVRSAMWPFMDVGSSTFRRSGAAPAVFRLRRPLAARAGGGATTAAGDIAAHTTRMARRKKR